MASRAMAPQVAAIRDATTQSATAHDATTQAPQSNFAVAKATFEYYIQQQNPLRRPGKVISGIWVPSNKDDGSGTFQYYLKKTKTVLLEEMHKRNLPTEAFKRKDDLSAALTAHDDSLFQPALAAFKALVAAKKGANDNRQVTSRAKNHNVHSNIIDQNVDTGENGPRRGSLSVSDRFQANPKTGLPLQQGISAGTNLNGISGGKSPLKRELFNPDHYVLAPLVLKMKCPDYSRGESPFITLDEYTHGVGASRNNAPSNIDDRSPFIMLDGHEIKSLPSAFHTPPVEAVAARPLSISVDHTIETSSQNSHQVPVEPQSGAQQPNVAISELSAAQGTKRGAPDHDINDDLLADLQSGGDFKRHQGWRNDVRRLDSMPPPVVPALLLRPTETAPLPRASNKRGRDDDFEIEEPASKRLQTVRDPRPSVQYTQSAVRGARSDRGARSARGARPAQGCQRPPATYENGFEGHGTPPIPENFRGGPTTLPTEVEEPKVVQGTMKSSEEEAQTGESMLASLLRDFIAQADTPNTLAPTGQQSLHYPQEMQAPQGARFENYAFQQQFYPEGSYNPHSTDFPFPEQPIDGPSEPNHSGAEGYTMPPDPPSLQPEPLDDNEPPSRFIDDCNRNFAEEQYLASQKVGCTDPWANEYLVDAFQTNGREQPDYPDDDYI